MATSQQVPNHTKGATMSNAIGICQTLPIAEVDKIFFGQGRHQKAQARVLCHNCPLTDVCAQQARIRTTVQRADGLYTSEAARTWGTFAGETWKDGQVIARN